VFSAPAVPLSASADTIASSSSEPIDWEEEQRVQAAIRASLDPQGQEEEANLPEEQRRQMDSDGYVPLDMEVDDDDDDDDARSDAPAATAAVVSGGARLSLEHREAYSPPPDSPPSSVSRQQPQVVAVEAQAVGSEADDPGGLEAAEVQVSLFFDCLQGANTLDSAVEDGLLSELLPSIRAAQQRLAARVQAVDLERRLVDESTLGRILDLHERLTHAIDSYERLSRGEFIARHGNSESGG